MSCAIGPSIDDGLDQNVCEGDKTLTTFNPDDGILSWNNGALEAVSFTPRIGLNTYIVSSDLYGCIASDTVIVNVNTSPSFTFAATNPRTFSGTDGFITLTG